MCDLDNDLSITNYPSYLGESLELNEEKDLKGIDDIDGAEKEYNTIEQDQSDAKNGVIDDVQNGSGLLELDPFVTQVSKLEIGENRLSNLIENDPFLEDNQSAEHGFVINSPFSKPSAELISQEGKEKTRRSIFEESNFSAQELKSSIIDDFKNLKAGM